MADPLPHDIYEDVKILSIQLVEVGPLNWTVLATYMMTSSPGALGHNHLVV